MANRRSETVAYEILEDFYEHFTDLIEHSVVQIETYQRYQELRRKVRVLQRRETRRLKSATK